ncbi:hypothetical protein LSAT2_005204 [Lamellibrachia satsuma]|nr:hypothetical protein LSAT2_005204 [Lamellibrachia satsuma]
MQRLLVLLAVVVAVRRFSTYCDADHVHDQDTPCDVGLKAPSVLAARENAISNVELDVSADANDLRMKELQDQWTNCRWRQTTFPTTSTSCPVSPSCIPTWNNSRNDCK